MKQKFKYLILLPLTAIVSCGYSSSYLVEGDKYVSAKFEQNYYTHWDDELKEASKHEKPIIDVTNKKITSLKDLANVDPNYFDSKIPSTDEYGAQFHMGGLDDSFRYGYQSKLFDGQMVCGRQNGNDGTDGRPDYSYQKGRVQIDKNGFSVRFSKESSDLYYFALQFKASTDDTVDCFPVNSDVISRYGTTPVEHARHDDKIMHNSIFTIKVTLYTKNGMNIEAQPFTSTIEFLDNTTNNGGVYKFFAFSLQDYNLSRLIGASITFNVDYDNLIEWNNHKREQGETVADITYAVFLYEMFFPYTSWN